MRCVRLCTRNRHILVYRKGHQPTDVSPEELEIQLNKHSLMNGIETINMNTIAFIVFDSTGKLMSRTTAKYS